MRACSCSGLTLVLLLRAAAVGRRLPRGTLRSDDDDDGGDDDGVDLLRGVGREGEIVRRDDGRTARAHQQA